MLGDTCFGVAVAHPIDRSLPWCWKCSCKQIGDRSYESLSLKHKRYIPHLNSSTGKTKFGYLKVCTWCTCRSAWSSARSSGGSWPHFIAWPRQKVALSTFTGKAVYLQGKQRAYCFAKWWSHVKVRSNNKKKDSSKVHTAYIVSICKSSIIFKRTLQGNQHILSLDTTSWVSGENASVAALA
jgi:hypothetical protein